MIIAPKKILAPCNAAYSVGVSVRAIAVACVLGGVVSGAMADPGGQSRGDDQRMQSQPRSDQRTPRALDSRLDQSQVDTRAYEVRAEEQRRQIQEQARSEARKSGRMTPDERRDLRRQINEAGQDLYATPPRR
jgi:hypothetical protein